MTSREWDVAVVGAGPAGSVAATRLARSGHSVILFDRQHFPRPKACAEYLSPGVASALRDLDLGSVLHDALPVHGMDIVAPSGGVLRMEHNGEPAGTLPRFDLDARLVEMATAAGADLREGSVVHGPIVEEGRVRGVMAGSHGKTAPVRARLVIAADGNRSVIGKAMGLTRAARWPVRIGLVAHYRGALPTSHGRMHVFEDGYCGVAPLRGGLLNVAAVLPIDTFRRLGLTPSALLDSWARRQGLRDIVDERVTPVRGISPIGTRTSRAFAPGVVLAGDAAGFFDPFTGEGIYRAVRSGSLAAQVTADVLDGRGTLAQYQKGRRDAFGPKWAVTALVQFFVQFPPLLEYAVPRLSDRPLPRSTLTAVLSDLTDARRFLTPRMLWSALAP